MMKGIIYALCAALLFGASTPLEKSSLPQVAPMLMAGLLYLGSGIGLAVFSLIRSRTGRLRSHEAALTRLDWPWLAGAIAAGGISAPVLLMWGLATTPASSASLLLNLEDVEVQFREKDRKPQARREVVFEWFSLTHPWVCPQVFSGATSRCSRISDLDPRRKRSLR